jgi:arylsulfatase A-like enzyme
MLAACALASGCGRAPVAAPDVVRLVDVLLAGGGGQHDPIPTAASPPVVLASEPFDDAASDALVLVVGERLRRLLNADDGRDGAGPGAARSVGTDDGGRGVLLEGPVALLRLVPVETGGAALRVRLRATGLDAATAHVIEITRSLTTDQLASDEVLRRELIAPSAFGHPLRPAGPAEEAATDRAADSGDEAGDDPGEHRADLRCSQATQALLLMVVVPEGHVMLDHLDLVSLPVAETLALLPGDDFPDRRVRRVEIDDETRESIVLPAPARVWVPVRLPDREPVLRLGAAVVVGADLGDARVEIEVRAADAAGGERPVGLALEGVGHSWRDASLDLSPLAGRDCTVTITAMRAAAADGTDARFGIAIGTPVVEGLPADPASLPDDVVLISLDTVRADRLALYGAGRDTSPHLDELARGAFVFEQAVAPSNWTLPSHASIFTGQLPERHGVRGPFRRLGEQHAPLLAESFRAAGYETVAVTAGGFVHPEFGFARGFERYGTREVVQLDVEGTHPELHPASAAERSWLLELLRRPRRRPLFLFVHTYTAHDYRAERADLLAVGVPESGLGDVPAGFTAATGARWLADAAARDGEDVAVARVRSLYDATLRGADRLVGDVAGALRSAGRLERTLLAVFSDHGEELYEHGRFGHAGYLWEELIRVPLLLRIPGRQGRRVPQVVSLVDLAPTLRALAGLPDGPPGDGRSLAGLLADASPPERPAVAQTGGRAALRADRMKLIVIDKRPVGETSSPMGTPAQPVDGADGGPTRRLFDVADDPREDRDIAPDRPDVVAALARALAERLDAARRGAVEQAEQALSAARQDELRELGYLGGG